MSTNFSRHRAQLRCESIFNCTTPDQWKGIDFKSLQLDRAQANLLSLDLKEDAKDIYFKGVLSFFEAIKSIHSKLYSWATVKIYYSLYYFIRSAMAANDVALIRHKSLFYLRANEGEQPISKRNKKYSSDHSGTINYFIDLFSSDILLSQPIGTTNAYEWILNKREQINYRERTFNEPSHSDFWDYIASQVVNGNLEKLINDYYFDKYILCFQEENAILAIPLKRALLTRERLYSESIDVSLSEEKITMLKNLLPNSNIWLGELLNTTTATNTVFK